MLLAGSLTCQWYVPCNLRWSDFDCGLASPVKLVVCSHLFSSKFNGIRNDTYLWCRPYGHSLSGRPTVYRPVEATLCLLPRKVGASVPSSEGRPLNYSQDSGPALLSREVGKAVLHLTRAMASFALVCTPTGVGMTLSGDGVGLTRSGNGDRMMLNVQLTEIG